MNAYYVLDNLKCHKVWTTPRIGEYFQKVARLLVLSRVWLFATPGPVAHQAPLSMGYFR